MPKHSDYSSRKREWINEPHGVSEESSEAKPAAEVDRGSCWCVGSKHCMIHCIVRFRLNSQAVFPVVVLTGATGGPR